MPTRRTTALAVTVLTALTAGLLASGATAGAAPDAHRGAPTKAGQLDATFSPAGIAGITDVVPNRQLVDVAVQHDGKVVAVSDQTNDFFVVRFNVDGSVDNTFGLSGNGTVSVDIGGAGQVDQAFAVLVDPQDRIVVAGSGGAAISDVALVRLTADGKSAQINTHVHIGNAADPSPARDVALQSDGTIVVAGTAKVGGDTDFAILRVSGSTGATVGSPVTQSLGTGDETGRAVAVYPSGPDKDKIVVAGDTSTASSNSAFAVIQRNADGTLDSNFNGNTPRIVDPTTGNDSARGVAITPSGSILVAGHNGAPERDLALFQLLPSGAFDGAFNLGGVRTLTKPGADFAQTHPLALQPDGRILLVGDTNSNVDVGVFRFNSNGSLDSTFGSGGDASFDLNGNDDGNAVAVDGAGRILVVGDDVASAGFAARLLGVPDSDGDGVADNVDACPSVAAPTANGCPPPPPEAVLKGKKVVLNTVLAKKKPSAKCPRRALVVVTTKTARGGLAVAKKLRTKADPAGCRVKGKVRLPVKPKKSAKVKVQVSGKKLRPKRLVAVRL